MRSHFSSPRNGTCDIIFMTTVADTKRNLNAPGAKKIKKKTAVTFSRPKTLQNLIYSGQTLRNMTLKLWRPLTLSRKCSPGKLSEKGTNFKQNTNDFDFSATKWKFIIAHKHALQSNEGSK